MNSRMLIGILAAGLATGSLAPTALAEALEFPAAGLRATRHYTANVAHRLGEDGRVLARVTRTLGGMREQVAGSHENVVGGRFASWQLGPGITSDEQSATVRVELDQTYRLKRIITWYGDYWPSEREVRISADGQEWTVVAERAPIVGTPASETHPFDAREARFIEWQVWGPSQLGEEENAYVYLRELQAFVAAPARDDEAAPRKDQGYNIGLTARVVEESGWVGGHPARWVVDGNPGTWTQAAEEGAMVVLDLGEELILNRIRLDFFGAQGWTEGTVQISADREQWTSLAEAEPLDNRSGDLGFEPTPARFIKVIHDSGNESGGLVQVLVYAAPAEAPEGSQGRE